MDGVNLVKQIFTLVLISSFQHSYNVVSNIQVYISFSALRNNIVYVNLLSLHVRAYTSCSELLHSSKKEYSRCLILA